MNVAIQESIRSSEAKWSMIADLSKSCADLEAENTRLQEQVDDADRRAGAAERLLAFANDSIQKRRQWLDRAKDTLGYHRNVSFDRVWADTLDRIESGDRARERFSERVHELRSGILDVLSASDTYADGPVLDDALAKARALVTCGTCGGTNIVTGPWGATDCLDCNPPLQSSDVNR